MSETKKNTSWLFEVFYRSLTLEHFQAGLLGHHLASLIAECSHDELVSIEADLRGLAKAKTGPAGSPSENSKTLPSFQRRRWKSSESSEHARPKVTPAKLRRKAMARQERAQDRGDGAFRVAS